MRDEPDPPAFRWVDRRDALGFIVGALIVAGLVAIGALIWTAIAIGCGAANIVAFALRRRAGIPTVTLRQRARRRPRAH